jgi:uncharacterized protein YwgA
MAQDTFEDIASIVRDAGGRIVGRTKLQKITYILQEAGLVDGFDFEYYHYGPYSEQLASTAKNAVLLGVISEREQAAAWGGSYSTYEAMPALGVALNEGRVPIAQAAAKANSVELELAATALYLFKEGYTDPWAETARRKPEKADDDRLARAKDLYQSLRSFAVPKQLPQI